MIRKIAKCQGKISEKSGNLKVEDKRQPTYDKQEITTSFGRPIESTFALCCWFNEATVPRYDIIKEAHYLRMH